MSYAALNPIAGKLFHSTCIAIGSLCIGAAVALADNPMPGPQLMSVFPAGGRQGSHVTVTIAGTDLDDATSLVFSHPGLSARPKLAKSKVDNASRPVPEQFDVVISSDVPPGLYEVRTAGPSGVSNPRTFAVGRLNEIVDRNPPDSFSKAREISLESTVNGVMQPERADFFKFSAKKEQRILFDAWARRIDSQLDPRLIVYDSSSRELTRANEHVHRDLLLDFVVPADGTYVVKFYDFLFAGGPNFPYRLTVSTAPHLDFIMPPSGVAGSKATYSLFGRNLPGGKPTGQRTPSGAELERLDVDIALPDQPQSSQSPAGFPFAEATQFGEDAFAYRLKTPRGDSNPVSIFFAAAPVVREKEPNDTPAQAQKLSLPCEVVGQFNPRGDQDWYQFEAHKGDAWTIEVFSQRLGLSTDPFLLVQRVIHEPHQPEKMVDIAQADDSGLDLRHTPGESYLKLVFADPVMHFVAPADGTYRILVRDLYGESRGSPELIYRLAIHRPAPEFRPLALQEPPGNTDGTDRMDLWSGVVHRGQSTAVNVLIDRRDGFSGPIQLSVDGLPKEITCPGAIVGPGSDLGTLVFTDDVKPSAKLAPWSGPVRILAKAEVAGRDVMRNVAVAAAVWPVEKTLQDPVEFRLTPQLTLSTSDNATPEIKIELGDGKPVETAPGATAKFPVKVARIAGSKGPLKCYLVGLSPGMSATELDVPPDAKNMSIWLNITSQLAPGKYSLALRAYSFVNCRNNAEEADRATAQLKPLEKASADWIAAATKAAAVKKTAEKNADRADAAVRRALESLAAASRNVHLADERAKGAASSLQPLEQLASKVATQLRAAEDAHAAADRRATNPNEPDIAAAIRALTETAKAVRGAREQSHQVFMRRDGARVAAQSAIAGVSLAEGAKAAADRKLSDALASAKIASTARTAGQAAASAATAKSHLPDEEKLVAAEVARRANAFATPRDYTLLYYSNPVEFVVEAAPLKMALPAEISARAGQRLEVPLAIERRFGFADVVHAELVAPAHASDLHAIELSIPSRQSQAKLVVAIDPKAKPAKYDVMVRARMTFNNQPSQVEEPISIKVLPADEPVKQSGPTHAVPVAPTKQTKK